jgi:SET domain-containing protein
MTKTATDQPPWHQIRKSKVHGNGVFARADISEGTRILEYLGEKITKKESDRRGWAQFEKAQKTGDAAVYLFILNKKHDIDGNVPWNDARLINHTCEPNCEAQVIRGKIWIIALRDIAKGEELGFNYGFDLENYEDHPCRCGTPSCVGFIAGEDYWEKLERKLEKKRKRELAKK